MSKKKVIQSGLIILAIAIAGLISRYILPDRQLLALTKTCRDPLPERNYLDTIEDINVFGTVGGISFYPDEIWLSDTQFGGLNLKDNNRQITVNINQLGKALPKIYANTYKEYKIDRVLTSRGVPKQYYVLAGFYPAKNERVSGKIYLCDEANSTFIEGYFLAEIVEQ